MSNKILEEINTTSKILLSSTFAKKMLICKQIYDLAIEDKELPENASLDDIIKIEDDHLVFYMNAISAIKILPLTMIFFEIPFTKNNNDQELMSTLLINPLEEIQNRVQEQLSSNNPQES